MVKDLFDCGSTVRFGVSVNVGVGDNVGVGVGSDLLSFIFNSPGPSMLYSSPLILTLVSPSPDCFTCTLVSLLTDELLFESAWFWMLMLMLESPVLVSASKEVAERNVKEVEISRAVIAFIN